MFPWSFPKVLCSLLGFFFSLSILRFSLLGNLYKMPGIQYHGQMTLVVLFISITKRLKIIELVVMLLKEKNNRAQVLAL